MAFGFGFNREKALAAAEKFVQQGKLQNAISEYEKIIKEDPKDLTVLNTVGDLCARVGQNDQAAHYFKKAGNQYAQDGFTVKAIAIYKKLTRLHPGDIEYVNKLAELYTQQGLVSDARSQYMQLADHYLKAADNSQAAHVLQRILELDPENTATKSKLADLYLKLGKKDDARNIYFTAAESLYARGSYDAAEEALDRVIKMDPANPAALLLRGKIAADSGDSDSAARYLAQVPDIESSADGLRALLSAKIQSNNAEGLEKVASKLLTVHHDASGVRDVANWYLDNQRGVDGLRLYEAHATTLMKADRKAFQESLHPLIVRIKDNPDALAIMMRLVEKSEDSSNMAELTELQAHAFAQKGRYQEARDLYHRLSELEPENALHQQNYKQMQSKLGEDPASRTLSPEEAAQAFMVESLEEAAPAVHQNYDPGVEKAIEAALTDAELFVSYNVPAKAIPPLEAVLPMAPRDVTVNQRLATLYARGGKYAEAARCCETLSEIYRERGHEKEASQYLEAAQSYSLRVPKPAASKLAESHPPAAMVQSEQPAIAIDLPAEPAAPSVQEFSFDVPDHLSQAEPITTDSSHIAAASVQEVNIEPDAEIQIAPATAEVAVSGNQHVQEVDISSEWEDMLTVEAEAPTAIDVPAHPVETTSREIAPAAPTAEAADPAAEKIQEIQFYIDQQMWDLAKKAILDLTEIAPDAPEITNLISAVSAGQARTAGASQAPAEARAVAAAAEFAIEVEAPKPVAPPVISPPPLAEPAAPAARAQAKTKETPELVIAPSDVPARNEPSAVVEKSPLPELLEQSQPAPSRKQKEFKTPPAPVVPPPVEKESPLEDVLETVAPATAKPAAPKKKEETKKPAKAAKQEKTTEDILSDFVGDLEKTDLADFAPQPKSQPEKGPLSVPTPKVAPPAPAAASAPMAAVAAVAAPEKHAANGDLRSAETTSMLSDILAELQEDTVEESEEEGDPETHYNLGIAFKEMGLLDEAIGELQKVCRVIDRGNDFSQPIQAYTWLAQCLVDKGAPEAAVRWYQKALHLPVLDDSSRCAIYYDLAAAYEASGDNKSALANFMEVYGSNIDFRDVASRIKALKS